MSNTSKLESPKIKKVFSFADMTFFNEAPIALEEHKTNNNIINNNAYSLLNKNSQTKDKDINNPYTYTNTDKTDLNQIYTSPNKRKYLRQSIPSYNQNEQNNTNLSIYSILNY